MDGQDLVGREYLRVSRDRSGVGRSPDEQHDENKEQFRRRGWHLHPEPYRDEGSASRYARRARQGFLRLCEDLEGGHFGADVLVLWEASRGSRSVGEWDTLLTLCERSDIHLFVTTHGRLYDPKNARDRRTLLEDAVDSEYESAKTSTRLLRSAAASAKAGRPHGKSLWGYRRVYDSETRQLLRVEPDPETGPLVQEAARRFLSGDTCYDIAKDWNSRQIPPRRPPNTEHRQSLGWTPEAVRDILGKPSYAGQRTHKGEVVAEASWPALISRNDWEQIRALLQSRTRPTSFEVRHLLSGIARCAVCGGHLKVGRQRSGHRLDSTGGRRARKTYLVYVCRGVPGRTRFHVAMRQTHLDDAVSEALIARMEQSDFLALVGQRDEGVDQERALLLDEIEGHRAYLDEIRARAATEQRIDLLFDQEERVRPLVRRAEARLQRLAAVDPAVVEIAGSSDVRGAWERMVIEDRRRVVRALLVPTIHRSRRPRGSKGPDLDRVELLWN